MVDPWEVDAELGEWIELFNSTAGDVNLVGWELRDSYGEGFTFTADVIVPAMGFAVPFSSQAEPLVGVVVAGLTVVVRERREQSRRRPCPGSHRPHLLHVARTIERAVAMAGLDGARFLIQSPRGAVTEGMDR
jgi:hypothetical protein